MRVHQHLSNKARSKRSEARAATLFKGRLQPASGAMKPTYLKGDVKSDLFLVDDKTTIHESYSLPLKVWRKLANEAWSTSRRPAMRIEFPTGTELVVLEAEMFKEMLEVYLRNR